MDGKGEWADVADTGIVPEPATTDDDAQLSGRVVGKEALGDEPATDTGVDLHAGDHADATTDGGPDDPPPGVEPDLKDAMAATRKPDVDSAR
jgi:hypothetical protein